VPVFANGNILYHSDIEKCLAATGADAVMSAESQLYNAALFAAAPSPSLSFDVGLRVHHTQLALEYLEIVKRLKTKTPIGIVKGHLFKLMRPGLAKEKDLRERLGRIQNKEDWLDQYVEIVVELKQRMEVCSQSPFSGPSLNPWL
jgi:tRNA-dihydrouridine synthase 1